MPGRKLEQLQRVPDAANLDASDLLYLLQGMEDRGLPLDVLRNYVIELVEAPEEGATDTPGPPTNLDVVPGVVDAVATWEPPRVKGGSAILGYRWQVRQLGGDLPGWTTLQPLTATAINLIPLTDYIFYVQAHNDEGWGESATYVFRTTTAVDADKPGLVTELNVTDLGADYLVWTWGPPDSGADPTAYQWSFSTDSGANWTPWADTQPTLTLYVNVGDLSAGVTYQVRVRAVAGVVAGDYVGRHGTTLGISTGTVPASSVQDPVDFVLISSAGNDMLAGEWPESEGATGYTIQPVINYVPSPVAPLHRVGAEARSSAFSAGGATFRLAVVALNSAPNITDSNPTYSDELAVVRTASFGVNPLDPITDLAAIQSDSVATNVLVTFTAVVDATSYRIELRREDQLIQRETFLSGEALYSHTFERVEVGVYTVWGQALNNTVNRTDSDVVKTRPFSVTLAPIQQAPPTSVTSVAPAFNQGEISWRASAVTDVIADGIYYGPATGYTVQLLAHDAVEYSIALGENAESNLFSDVAPGGYEVRVKALNSAEHILDSVFVNGLPVTVLGQGVPVPNTQQVAPAALAVAQDNPARTATATWAAAAGATGYTAELRSGSRTIATANTNLVETTFTALRADLTYHVRVRANNTDPTVDDSMWINSTTFMLAGVTEQQAPPTDVDAFDIIFTSMLISWHGVAEADGYQIILWESLGVPGQTTFANIRVPATENESSTTDNSHVFNNIPAGSYTPAIRALNDAFHIGDSVLVYGPVVFIS